MKVTIVVGLLIAALGCHRVKDAMTVADTTDSRDTRTPAQRAVDRIPIAKRTLTQVDLQQLQTYMNQYHAEHNRYPATIAELNELNVSRDLRKVGAALESGELVLAGGRGGVLAYEAIALQDRGNVLTTNGVQMMTSDDLRRLLGR